MISDESVEAAARVVADHVGYGWVGADHRELAREILEAAAPYMLAEAWDEGMEAMYESTSHEWPPIPETNPYRSKS